MEIVITILLLILVLANIYVLYLMQNNEKKHIENKNKPKLTKEEKDKQEKIKEAFDNLMNYDEKIARSRK